MSALSAENSPTDRDVLFGILGSHPRLGRPKVAQEEKLSALSEKEQAQLNVGAEELAEKLRAMNEEYEGRFPGLRFVYVFLLFFSSSLLLSLLFLLFVLLHLLILPV